MMDLVDEVREPDDHVLEPRVAARQWPPRLARGPSTAPAGPRPWRPVQPGRRSAQRRGASRWSRREEDPLPRLALLVERGKWKATAKKMVAT